jgi:hypothetical protein
MKIGILTQRLYNNYGGILQNYALQQVLKELGHFPITIDYRPRYNLFFYLISQFRTLLLHFIPGKKRPFRKFKNKPKRDRQLSLFIDNNIHTTHRIQKIFPFILSQYKFDAIIVGSDQVWRPKYNTLENTFLSFIKSETVIKIAYAASFGVDHWEYTDKQTKICKKLVSRFNAVSVREFSGIELCDKYLKIKAIETLDPTLLLDKRHYSELCSDICINKKYFLAAYILDLTDDKKQFIETFSRTKNIEPIYFSAETNVTLTIEEWLSMFRDASFIITDSYHGTIFSIINEKPFISFVNEKRGADRFFSLLSKFGLENRIIKNMDIQSFDDKPIDWEIISSIIDLKKHESINFLLKYLGNI